MALRVLLLVLVQVYFPATYVTSILQMMEVQEYIPDLQKAVHGKNNNQLHIHSLQIFWEHG